MTTVDITTTLNKTFREHRRYSEDGLPNPPSGAPLPVGDPSSGVHNPAKSDIRGAFTDVQTVLQTAVDAAETAADEAEAAETGAEAALAEAEAAAAQALIDIDAAEDAAVGLLEGLVNDAVSVSNVPIVSTRNGLEILTIPAGLGALRTNGYAIMGDGGQGLYVRVDEEPSHPGKVRSADRFLPSGSTDATNGGWWALVGSEICPEQFGAKNDDATPDDAAFDAAYAFLMTQPNGGAISLKAGAAYRLDTKHDFHPFKPLRIKWEEGALIRSSLIGPDEVLFQFTHPTIVGERGQRLVLENPRIFTHSSVPADAIGACYVEYHYASDLKIVGTAHLSHYRINRVVSLSNLWNCDLGDFMVWGGGETKVKKLTTGVTFSITSGSTTLTASASHFEASDAGRTLALGANHVFTVDSYVSPTQVTVKKAAESTVTAQPAVWEGVRGSMTSGSAALTLTEAAYTADDIGRTVWVLDAVDVDGTRRRPLRAQILDVAGTTVTLDKAATASVTNVYVLIPAVEIMSLADPLMASNTNDYTWRDLHVEQARGVGLIVDGALNQRLDNIKIHGWNFSYTNQSTTLLAVFAACGGQVNGDFEGTPVNDLGRIYVCGSNRVTGFGPCTGVGVNGQFMVHADWNGPGLAIDWGAFDYGNSVANTTTAYPVRIVGQGKYNIVGANKSNGTTSITPFVFSEQVRLGTRFPNELPAGAGSLMVSRETGTPASIRSTGTSAAPPQLNLDSQSGTFASPTTLAEFNTTGLFSFRAYFATGGLKSIGRIQVVSRATTAADCDGRMEFHTMRRSDASLAARFTVTHNSVFPGADNANSLGLSSARWSIVYAGTGTINTSDERDKQDIEGIPDEWLDAWGDVEWVRYRWREAVAERGEEARWHIGLIAQRVRDAFAARGLDAFEIGLLCFDEWEYEAGRPARWVEVGDLLQPEIRGDDGEITQEAIYATEREMVAPGIPERQAGNRFGLRYDECFAMEATWVRRQMVRLTERLNS